MKINYNHTLQHMDLMKMMLNKEVCHMIVFKFQSRQNLRFKTRGSGYHCGGHTAAGRQERGLLRCWDILDPGGDLSRSAADIAGLGHDPWMLLCHVPLTAGLLYTNGGKGA